ncbi:MAG: vitamin B12-dependent ribonucleotide reductase, partial [Candidatus Saccharimonadales bacterium]
LRRHFTQKGVHPYDEIEWDKRDARITNYLDGSVAFEQKNVEFPKTWSLNATNIVAQKYFYGTPGEGNRESSLKELIDRVADTITGHGAKKGYFASDEEVETFNQELKHLLVNQKAAFNSPVWFNIGTPDRTPQASACFILAVEDTMESILNWYKEEGMIFKGGSGSGVNLSSLRSSYEELSKSGGKSSGPVSFMRGADSVAGTIKSGGKTRRAAKMVILNADHPDVEEFIWTKAIEERKIHALKDAGFDMELNGSDIHSVQFQNANNSVRVTDEFMEAVENDEDWDLKAVRTGEVVKTVKARKLMHDIAVAAWECADPGMQYDTTINRWNTAANTGRINGSNPCSEYMHLDNSACNLASINLLKFLNRDGSFDVAGFRQAVEIVFTAQEILVGYSSYPTERITKNAKKFRQLGLGYANLGALLMAKGLPYDSDEGRAMAAAITALMTGHAYATSGRLSKRVGPFGGFEDNVEPMLKVLRQHRSEVVKIDASLVPEELLSAAQNAWDEANDLAELYGVRNSQASVLAPTGTIGLMMDCDTTGVEPDLGLVKTKKLVGGGTMSIVNQTVPRALNQLGYSDEQIQAIIKYIDEEKTIVGAPELNEEHLPVFACSMGDNVIHHYGHIRMMSAVQPFISGAISKTVNMPEEATVEEIEKLYIDSWKLGLKAVAIYRDNCKVGQPLSGTKKEEKQETPEAVAPVPEAATKETNKFVVKQPVRRELPGKRHSMTYKFHVADLKGYFIVGEYEDGKPGEVFIQVAKQGSTLSGIMDAFAISISTGLQYGVPLKRFVKTFTHMSFAPAGITSDPEITYASSLVDYIFRRIGKDYLSREDQIELGLATAESEEISHQATLLTDDSSETSQAEETEIQEEAPEENVVQMDEEVEKQAPLEAVSKPVVPQTKTHATESAPLCHNCGNPTQRSGSCYVCTACGSTSGCS